MDYATDGATAPDDFSTLPLEPLFPGTELDRPPSSNKRPLASSPETAMPALAFPRVAMDGMGDSDSFGSTSLHFGGRSVGMGKSLSSTSAPLPEAAQPTRKRLRRGAAREGSPASYLTSPADSDQSSTPAITSPAEDAEPVSSFATSIRERLAHVNVDSGPSSRASSVQGGSTIWDSTIESQESEGKGKGREETVVIGSSSPPPRPTGRLVRGRKPVAAEEPPLPLPPTSYNTFPASTSAPFTSAPAYSPIPTFASTPSFAPGAFPSPSFNPSTPTTPSTPSSLPPGSLEDPEFLRFATMVGAGTPSSAFSPLDAYAAWAKAGKDHMAAIGILVGAHPRQSPQPSFQQQQALAQQQQALAQHQQQQRQPVRLGQQGSPQQALQFQQLQSQQRPLHLGQLSPHLQQQPGLPLQQHLPANLQQQQQFPQPQPQQIRPRPAGAGYLPPYAPGQSQFPTPPFPQSQSQSFGSPHQQQQFAFAGQQQFAGRPAQAYPQQQGQPRPPPQQLYGQPQQQQQQRRTYQLLPIPTLAPAPPGQAYTQKSLAQFHQHEAFVKQNNALYQHQQLQRQRHLQQQQQQYQNQNRPAPSRQTPQQSLMSRTLAAVPLFGTPKRRKRAAVGSESEEDGGEYSDGSGDEYGGPSPAVVARRDALALEFFNTAQKDELGELAGCNPTQATLVIKLRPFSSTTDFRTRTRKQKGVGNQMLENYLDVMSGMVEVDKVLSECEQIGKELSQIMKIWAEQGTTGGAPAPTADVGLALVAIPEANVVERASASSDPIVRKAFEGYLREQPEGVPKTIVLKDYQMLGVNWLNLLYHRKTSCILADEMGLGKTAQVIALMAHCKSQGEAGPHLVIVPSSTLENWMREFSVFAPGLNVESYYGSQAERAEIRDELRAREDLDVVVTTYNIATSSPEDQKFLKRKMSFKMAVFDEGHQLKNSESKKYKDLMQIKAQWRLLLTGTPLQNNLQELVSLLSFILPDQFRDANESLRAIFKVGPGSQANLLSRERISRAKKMMTPFVLRRKKAQVLKDLPSKSERVEWCDMTDLQREVYNEAITRSKKALLELPDDEIEVLGEAVDEEEGEKPKPKKKGPRASSTKTGNKSDGNASSNVLMDLRKASNHPMLFRRLYTDKILKAMSRDCLKELEFTDRDQDLIYEDMEVMTDFELHRFAMGYKHLKKYCLQNDEWMSAGKINTLLRLLPELKANGDRVLLFSQFTQVLDILEVVLGTMGMKYLKLTGQTPVTERQGLVDEYSNDPEITVFLLSTRAGGLGLNLTTANTVIFYDQDYNPHNDKQAEDRSYRIGQVRDVTVIKLITKGSLEEDMRALATHKLLLDSSVSSSSQYPAVAGASAPAAEDEGNSGAAEKKMRTSLLSNLKKRFEGETQAVPGSQRGGASQAGAP